MIFSCSLTLLPLNSVMKFSVLEMGAGPDFYFAVLRKTLFFRECTSSALKHWQVMGLILLCLPRQNSHGRPLEFCLSSCSRRRPYSLTVNMQTAGGFGCFVSQCGTPQTGLISSKISFICPLKIRPFKNISKWKCKKAKASKICRYFFISWSIDSSNYNEKAASFFMARYYEPDSCLMLVLLKCISTHSSGVSMDL